MYSKEFLITFEPENKEMREDERLMLKDIYDERINFVSDELITIKVL